MKRTTYYIVEGRTYRVWKLVSRHKTSAAALRAARKEARRGCLPSYPESANWPYRVSKCEVIEEGP